MAASDEPYPIVGIQDGLDPDKRQVLRKVPIRMELDDWYQSTEDVHVNQRALFFPAFQTFSELSPREKLSYFQIAGIHGKPFIAWDEPPQKGATRNKGYCTHNSILFATWHRPYLLLFEQVIFNLMKEKAQEFPDDEKAVLLKAAESWRFPYWDWASKKLIPDKSRRDYCVPIVFREKTVKVRQPTGPDGDVKNAFYQFTMPDGFTMGDTRLGNLGITASEVEDEQGRKYTVPFNECKATSRHPSGKDAHSKWVNGNQDNEAVENKLRDYKWDPKNNTEDPKYGNLTAGLRDAFYRVLTIKNFEDFATKRAPGKGSDIDPNESMKDYAFDSSENLHDNMHGWCGGRLDHSDNMSFHVMGHMSHVPLAAFDPIFWVHHCNLDRLIAIWQILHKDSWFDGTDPRDEDMGTFAIQRGHHDIPQDILRPFHKDSHGNYWTSVDVREVTALGYTYPRLQKWNYTSSDSSYDKESHIKDLTLELNNSYNSSRAAAEKERLTANPGESDGVGLMSLNSLIEVTKQELIDLTINDYVVNVIYEKFALNGTRFTIHIFVGAVPDEFPYISEEPEFKVGEVFNFSTEPDSIGNSSDGCPNCRAQQEDHAESTGRVVLTNALITRFKNAIEHTSEGGGPPILRSMKPEDVVPFLKGTLHWRVTSMGVVVEIDRIPSLKVSLAAGKANHYADRTKLSEFYDYKGVYEVTQGRPGGAGPEDGLYPPGSVYRPEI